MTADTRIEWADSTFNPWLGCTKISDACDHCYAEGWAKRAGQPGLWAGARRRTTAATWRQPVAWEAGAAAFFAIHGRRQRVFCASLADVFDNQVPIAWQVDLLRLIFDTPSLDWMVLTKRPQNIRRIIERAIAARPPGGVDIAWWASEWLRGRPPQNVWLGATVETQEEVERRIPHLLAVPAAVHWLSCEPLLGPVDLRGLDVDGDLYALDALLVPDDGERGTVRLVIAGGETGPGARPTHPDWLRSLREACAATGTAFFFKHWGEWAPFVVDGPYEVHELRVDDRRVRFETLGGGEVMARVGRAKSGRLLDGVEHDGMPVAGDREPRP